MKKIVNEEYLQGKLYDHSLEMKTVQDQNSANYGKTFIKGRIDIAVDDECLNVVPVDFTYVTETNKSGGKNATYGVLASILNGNVATVIKDGKDNAGLVSVQKTSLALNDFWDVNNNVYVSSQKNNGGFVNIIPAINPDKDSNKFYVDMLITKVNRIEANEEKGIAKDYVILKGATFGYGEVLLPIELHVRSEQGMSYFENAGISTATPMFTKVWGKIVNASIMKKKVEQSGFGEDCVIMTETKVHEWLVTGVAKTPYDFGDEAVLTAEEVQAAQQKREVYLADVKTKRLEYEAHKDTKGSAVNATSAIKSAEFNF